jgi:transketolase
VGGLGSFDSAGMGRTHQTNGDVALMDTLPGIHIHAPSTSVEVDAVVRRTVAGDGLHYVRVVGQTNSTSYAGTGLHVVRRGAGATVVALGPVLDSVLAATEGLDVNVLYANTVRPFDSRALRQVLAAPDVVLVEPWLSGTSSRVVSETLSDLPHRVLALGVGREELRRYGTPADHVRFHGLDAVGIRRSLDAFLPIAA